MIRRDMPEVVQIASHSSLQWQEEDFLRCLRQRNYIGMVAECCEEIAGFMIYELHKKKLEVLHFAVHPKFRRNGVGTQMINKLKDKLSSHKRTKLGISVPERNLGLQSFLKKNFFQAIGVTRQYFEQLNEDSYDFSYKIS